VRSGPQQPGDNQGRIGQMLQIVQDCDKRVISDRTGEGVSWRLSRGRPDPCRLGETIRDQGRVSERSGVNEKHVLRYAADRKLACHLDREPGEFGVLACWRAGRRREWGRRWPARRLWVYLAPPEIRVPSVTAGRPHVRHTEGRLAMQNGERP